MSSVDSITLKKLILCKQLYLQALAYSMSPLTPVRKILSVICFDLSNETALNASCTFLEPTTKSKDRFPELIKQCDELCAKYSLGSLSDKLNIDHVHKIRNDAQHDAKYPNDSDVSDCRTYTRDFLNNLFNQIWHLTFENVSLTDIIQDTEVKAILIEAESQLASSHYDKAVEQASVGLSQTLNFVSGALVGRIMSFKDSILVPDMHGNPKEDRDIMTALKRMQDTLVYLALGINYSEYIHFREIAGYTVFTFGGSSNHGMKVSPDRNEADFAVHYAVDTVVQIEDQVGSIKSPYGKDWWLR